MKWTLSQLQMLRNKDYVIDEIVSCDNIKEVERSIREVSPIHVTGNFTMDGSKVTFYLTIEGTLTLPCSRTLVDVQYPVKVDTVEIFVYKPTYEQIDEDVHQVVGDSIDLLPIIEEILILEVPIQVFSKNEGEIDATMQSGRDWAVVTEQDLKNKIDPRLAKLANFFKEDNPSE